MPGKFKSKGILILALSLLLAFSGGAIANAATSTTSKQATQTTTMQKPQIPKPALDKLVKAGTIKQAQADAIVKALNSAKKTIKAVLDEMVKAKKITQAQATAVTKALAASGGTPPNGKNPIEQLVTTGKLTKTQSDSVMKALEAGRSKQEQINTTLDALVKAGTITTAQEKLILDNFKPQDNGSGGPDGTPPSGNPPAAPPTGAATNDNGAAVTGTAALSLTNETASKSGIDITASQANQSVVRASNASALAIENSQFSKTGDTSSEDNSNFYGLNAAILAESASKITVTNTTIATKAEGANAVFATGSNSKIYISNSAITTKSNSSRGLDATLGGYVEADNITISTEGTHCAALATDRGCGTIIVTGGTMNTSGIDSPGIYSTGDIRATNAKIYASGSEAAVVEGKNSITLNNTDIYGTKKRGVMLYQSFSGDAEVGTSCFTMTGGSLTAAVGPLFYATNTDTRINLTNAKLNAASGILLEAGAGNWGTTGSNGATVALTADNQELNGSIVCDNISTLTIELKNTSALSGAINTKNSAKKISLTLSKNSSWNVTEDSYLTELTDKDTTLTNIKGNGHTIYYNAKSTANSWLSSKTINLTGGGKLTPAE